jgi:hypothetical protein
LNTGNENDTWGDKQPVGQSQTLQTLGLSLQTGRGNLQWNAVDFILFLSGKGGCQSSNFDAQIADTTVSMIAYILLSFRYRQL